MNIVDKFISELESDNVKAAKFFSYSLYKPLKGIIVIPKEGRAYVLNKQQLFRLDELLVKHNSAKIRELISQAREIYLTLHDVNEQIKNCIKEIK